MSYVDNVMQCELCGSDEAIKSLDCNTGLVDRRCPSCGLSVACGIGITEGLDGKAFSCPSFAPETLVNETWVELGTDTTRPFGGDPIALVAIIRPTDLPDDKIRSLFTEPEKLSIHRPVGPEGVGAIKARLEEMVAEERAKPKPEPREPSSSDDFGF